MRRSLTTEEVQTYNDERLVSQHRQLSGYSVTLWNIGNREGMENAQASAKILGKEILRRLKAREEI